MEQLQSIHKTAIKICQIYNDFFWVEYPGLIMIIKGQDIAAFMAHGIWHIFNYYNSNLMDSIGIRFFDNKTGLLKEMKRLINEDSNEHV